MIKKGDILVSTTSSLEGLKVKQYLRPISAHIVAGTGFFSDFLAGLSDIFGGRSGTYQRQLTSLYNEAIDSLKSVAYEIGANCILGLHVDLDEISGKGKSMFMITALGTAALIEGDIKSYTVSLSEDVNENVSVEKMQILQRKREILGQASAGKLYLDDDIWEFITTNQVYELYDYIIDKLMKTYAVGDPDSCNRFYKKTVEYLYRLPSAMQIELLYGTVTESMDKKTVDKTCDLIKEFQLLDLDKVEQLLNSEKYEKQKNALRIITFDMPYYNKKNVEQLNHIKDRVQTQFRERGQHTTKKQLFSSKEKEIWTCDCGKTGSVGGRCSGCGKDIYGFEVTDITTVTAIAAIDQKTSLILEYFK